MGLKEITRACLAFKARKMNNPLSQPIINTKPWAVRWDQALAKRSCSTHNAVAAAAAAAEETQRCLPFLTRSDNTQVGKKKPIQ
jgi:hypothetical protein